MMSFDDALTRANFSFVYLLPFYFLIFLTFFNGGGLNPQPPLWLRHWFNVLGLDDHAGEIAALI